MKEQIKEFWNKNKEGAKTGVILVLIPIASLGLVAIGQLDKIINMANIGAELDRKKLQEKA